MRGACSAPQSSDDSRTGWVQQLSYRGPFPEKSTLTPMLPADLRDDANRPLSNLAAASMPIKIDAYPPLAKFSASFGIVEANADAAECRAQPDAISVAGKPPACRCHTQPGAYRAGNAASRRRAPCTGCCQTMTSSS
ncbi:MAG: hypothetical protein U1F55_08935 [Chitinivorax sp.]